MGVLGDCQELTCTNKPSTTEARDSLFLRGKASGLARVAPAQSGVSGWAVLSWGAGQHISAAPVVGTEGKGGTRTPDDLGPGALGCLQDWGS